MSAGFKHPLCQVPRGRNSRESVLKIYQWYRILSPRIQIEVKSVAYEPTQNVLYLDIHQTFHVRYNPFAPASARLITVLWLLEEDGVLRVDLQEDFYHPDDFMALVMPPLKPVIGTLLKTSSWLCGINTAAAQLFNLWKPTHPSIVDNTDVYEKSE